MHVSTLWSTYLYHNTYCITAFSYHTTPLIHLMNCCQFYSAAIDSCLHNSPLNARSMILMAITMSGQHLWQISAPLQEERSRLVILPVFPETLVTFPETTLINSQKCHNTAAQTRSSIFWILVLQPIHRVQGIHQKLIPLHHQWFFLPQVSFH